MIPENATAREEIEEEDSTTRGEEETKATEKNSTEEYAKTPESN